MTLRETLEKVKEIIGESFDLDEQGVKRDRLMASGISVYDELTCDYVHLKAEESVEFIDGICPFSAFSNKVKDILSVKRQGKPINFEMYPLFVRCEGLSGEAEVKYYYLPPEPEADSELILPPRFSVHMLANGIAAEYFYRSGMPDEAAYYRNRYEYSLNNAQARLRNLTLKADRIIC
ncbi:MAG: hypothetical protein ACOYIQ_02535 [Christensenellales bacterium]|jgi:hypothetical protein